jgi:hypothetical protein
MTPVTEPVVTLFHAFVVLHILCGSLGLVAFWIPVLGRKGSPVHRRWGRVFTWTMLATGSAAIGISLCTLIDPQATHPHLDNPTWIRGIFGWMMLGLAILTVNLAWYGWSCIQHREQHHGHREWRNLGLQALLTIASVACLIESLRIGEPLMLGMPAIGFATVATNLGFILKTKPAPLDWLKEHIKALVGAGISVYTAFFAFGAVRTIPALALHPGLWSIPLVVGLTLIIYHRHAITRRRPQNA